MLRSRPFPPPYTRTASQGRACGQESAETEGKGKRRDGERERGRTIAQKAIRRCRRGGGWWLNDFSGQWQGGKAQSSEGVGERGFGAESSGEGEGKERKGAKLKMREEKGKERQGAKLKLRGEKGKEAQKQAKLLDAEISAFKTSAFIRAPWVIRA